MLRPQPTWRILRRAGYGRPLPTGGRGALMGMLCIASSRIRRVQAADAVLVATANKETHDGRDGQKRAAPIEGGCDPGDEALARGED